MNLIHPTAVIDPGVELGDYNTIGKNVFIKGFKDSPCKVTIGDCNQIHDDVRIQLPEMVMGDWNVLHNHTFIGGDKALKMGHNCWVGQNSVLDSTGTLTIGNGVRIGMYSQVWSHAASAEEIEGCTLFAIRPTVIKDEVWLVGSCFVGSGVTLGYRSICLPGAIVTKDTEPLKVYAGAPAKEKEGLSYYKPVSISEKYVMMAQWAKEFCEKTKDTIGFYTDRITIRRGKMVLVITTGVEYNPDPEVTTFSVADKMYTKRLTELERDFYKFLFGHRSRFLPR